MQDENENKVEAYKEVYDAIVDVVVRHVERHLGREEIIQKMNTYIYFIKGDCYANRVLIDFPDKETLYYSLVQALVENTQTDRSCSYKSIIDYWTRKGFTVKQELKAQRRSVDNALTQLYNDRENQKIKFPTHTLDGKKLIEKKKDRLVFNNPTMVS